MTVTRSWPAGVHVVADRAALVVAAADRIGRILADSIARHGHCSLALAGGATPRPVYDELARRHREGDRAVDWANVWMLFGDERCVPPDDPASNYRMAREALLEHLPVREGRVLRMRGELDPGLAAADYEIAMARALRSPGRPVLDLVLLGLGDDGHTASLFPGTAAVRERVRSCVAQYVDKLSAWRLTLSPPVLWSARSVLFVVEGAGKAEALARVFEGPFQPDVIPAQLLASQAVDAWNSRPAGGGDAGPRVEWIVDSAAAERLGHSSRAR